MDSKQFEEFQTGVQWVQDEARSDTRHGLVRHNQKTWARGRVKNEVVTDEMSSRWMPVCASACCLAGNIVLAHGDTFVVPAYDSFQGVAEMGGECHVDYCMDDEGKIHSINERAIELAGLTDLQAGALFFEGMTAAKIVSYAAAVAEENGYHLDVK